MNNVANGFIREKQYRCSSIYKEVDIVPLTQNQIATCLKKRIIYNESLPKQRNLNDEHSRRCFVHKAEATFGAGDYCIEYDYNDINLPDTEEDAKKEIAKYFKRVAYACKKKGLPKPIYICVTSVTSSKDFTSISRVHHHVLIKCGLTRDELEDLWRLPRKKGEKKGKPIGRCNSGKLQPNEKGISEKINYFAKQMKQCDPNKPARMARRWTCSNGLNSVTITEKDRNDKRYKRKQINKLCEDDAKVRDVTYWEKKYIGWTIVDPLLDIRTVYNQYTGWSIYLTLRKKE